ncbi:MAG: hypothetical protein Barrevirus4_7 [Barrevirus sp.]|uniref:Uncharacterized protein n=1 Tax=Barrevirus sp. TaxID=2487763 RepID=A0A3G4ZTJ2_9VIRU|nr:MAG: hypothetical protein Barrevirus4_7 [Barrevirus sp.]
MESIYVTDLDYNLSNSTSTSSLDQDTDENTLKSLSWIAELDQPVDEPDKEEEEEIEELKDNKEDINIFSLDLKTLSDLEILEYQNTVISQLRGSENKGKSLMDNNDTCRSIDWLISSSKYLSEKIGSPLFKHKSTGNSFFIIRSSYKFCNLGYKCEFNYQNNKNKKEINNKDRKNGCNSQHYVHNLVNADLTSLREYISTNNSTNKVEKVEKDKEIQKSINTISFVINHMYEELKNSKKHIQVSNKKNMSRYHNK